LQLIDREKKGNLEMEKKALENHRSLCPVNLVVELIGDKWTLLVLRDIMFYKRRHFNELLRQSEEGIASNILMDRLATLEKEGMVTKAKGLDSHKQKVTYSLTEKSINMLDIIMCTIAWSLKYEPVDKAKYEPAIKLLEAGTPAIEAFRQRLKKEHLIDSGEIAER
jgi:DNA-binding HxlR family transcriptional regulator